MKDEGTLRPEQVSIGQDGQRPRRARGLPHRADDPRRQRHNARIPGDPAHEQPRVGAHVRGHARGAHARGRQRPHRSQRVCRTSTDWRGSQTAPETLSRPPDAGPRSPGSTRTRAGIAERPQDRQSPDSRPSRRDTARRGRSAPPASSGPKTSAQPFVVVAIPEIAPRCSGGISRKRIAHDRVITMPPATATGKMIAVVPALPALGEPARRAARRVDDRRDQKTTRAARRGRRLARRRSPRTM